MMRVKIQLHDKGNKPADLIERGFDVACKSDASQQVPKYIVGHRGRYYVYQYLDDVGTFHFREKGILV